MTVGPDEATRARKLRDLSTKFALALAELAPHVSSLPLELKHTRVLPGTYLQGEEEFRVVELAFEFIALREKGTPGKARRTAEGGFGRGSRRANFDLHLYFTGTDTLRSLRGRAKPFNARGYEGDGRWSDWGSIDLSNFLAPLDLRRVLTKAVTLTEVGTPTPSPAR